MSHGSAGRPGKRVFVGRENEVEALRAAWRSVTSGSARVVAIEGDPGIGKTALIETLLAEVRAPVVRVNGVEADSLRPWRVLEQVMARLPAPEPGHGGAADDGTFPSRRDPQASPSFVGQGLTEALQGAGELTLLIDDAQWADRVSMAALQYTVRRLRDDPILLIVAYRRHGDHSLPEYQTVSPGLSKAWRQIFDGEQGLHLALDGLPPEDLLRLAAANGYPGLSPEGAHPGRRERGFTFYDTELLDKVRAEVPIDGIEVMHPSHGPEVTEALLDYARKHDLLMSTGSDSHSIPNRMPKKYPAELSRSLLERVGIQVG